MKITFNGTGASEGFPALFCECAHCSRARKMDARNFRTRNSCFIDEALLIDFSADTYVRCLYGGLDLTKVKHLIVTHSHSDHLYPQDLCKIMPPYAAHNRQAPLEVYGNENVGRALEQAGAASPGMQPYLKFNLVRAFTSYDIGGYEILPLPANHDPNQACFIYIIKIDGKVLLYGHDSGYFFEETWAALKNCRLDAAVLDCTSGAAECPYASHMGMPDNRRVRERMYAEGIADAKTLFLLTHFAHTFAPFYDSMGKAAAENGFIAAYDGFQTEI